VSTVVVTDENTVVVTETTTPTVVTVISEGPQGPPGPPGPQGPAGGDTLTRLASGAIGGQRLLIGNSDETVSYADATNSAHLGKILGLSTNAANDGEAVTILLFGYTEFNGWTWNTSLPIYASTNGLLTQTPPSGSGFSQIVATAETATRIFFRLREPIAL
jgi:hypothetical protein